MPLNTLVLRASNEFAIIGFVFACLFTKFLKLLRHALNSSSSKLIRFDDIMLVSLLKRLFTIVTKLFSVASLQSLLLSEKSFKNFSGIKNPLSPILYVL